MAFGRDAPGTDVLVTTAKAIRDVYGVELSLNKVLQALLARVRSSAPTWPHGALVFTATATTRSIALWNDGRTDP